MRNKQRTATQYSVCYQKYIQCQKIRLISRWPQVACWYAPYQDMDVIKSAKAKCWQEWAYLAQHPSAASKDQHLASSYSTINNSSFSLDASAAVCIIFSSCAAYWSHSQSLPTPVAHWSTHLSPDELTAIAPVFCMVSLQHHSPAADGPKQCCQLIVGVGKFQQISVVLHEALHWLPVCQRILFTVAIAAFDYIRGTGPASFKDICVPVTDIFRWAHLSSAKYHNMPVPHIRTQFR